MSPEQQDAWTNFALWVHDQIDDFGPGVLLCAAVWAFVYACRLIRPAWRAAGRRVAEILDLRQWQQSTAADQDPHLDTEFDELGQHLKAEYDRIRHLYADGSQP
ncbi:hypothetical protein [Streptomyces sp. N35]|uniref:hypothetical protein n=1 Tax=Streptomyces sp. N35 TaxID=2795730 RepID=UPI0018F6EBCB|nr:hypothetical protein [Streptomyces sp. N35]